MFVKFSVAAVAAVITPVVASPTAAALPSCTTDSVILNTSAPASPGDATQIHFGVIVTSTSTQSCELLGCPDVDLIGPDDPMWGPDYQLPQQAGDPQPVALGPGGLAASRLTFLADPTGWATHPGAYIGPFQAAAE